jgi:hypothetical protein
MRPIPIRETPAPNPSDRSRHSEVVVCTLGSVRSFEPTHGPEGIPSLNELGIDNFVQVKRDSYRHASESIKQKRSEILRDATTEPIDPAEAQALGRLLLYEAMETVSDGAAQASSHGFFDIEDAPPWDTWFWYKDGTIFCWVPDSLVSDAQAGIDANPVDCIHWAKWSALSALINR